MSRTAPGLRPSLDELRDRAAIRDVLAAFTIGVDRRDFELFSACFWPGATDDHGTFQGSIEDFTAWLEKRSAQFKRTQHVIGHSHYQFDGGVAHVETHFHVYQLQPGASGELVDEFMGGRYLDRFERRGEEWRIAHRQLVFDWYREYTDPLDWEAHPFRKLCHLGKHRPDDARYAVFSDED